ncbi:MAG: Na(+)-translocating NADH-quinone reductase subunit A [Arenicella sp.]
MLFKLSKGLDLPIIGAPDQRISEGKLTSSVAVLGEDYIGLKPTMLVQVGDSVEKGQALFEDKKNPGVFVTAPAAGTVAAINRGAKRALLSVVIEKSGDAEKVFQSFDAGELHQIDESLVRKNLQESGLWTALRSRPYSKVPAIDAKPSAIFVTAMDTNPLAADPSIVLQQDPVSFQQGLTLLTNFGVKTYVCKAPEANIPVIDAVEVAEFAGPHPAGLPGTHIHYLNPVNAERSVWYVNYQDVVAIGKLFVSGKLDSDRVISVAGPLASSPRLLKTELGANIDDILQGATLDGEKRVISGSVLNGVVARGDRAYVGRYHLQVSVIREDHDRHLFGWIMPGAGRFSKMNVFISSLFKNKRFNLTSSQNGSPRAIVPIGVFEKIVPLDILPTPLLKAILVKDTDSVQQLGGLELDEEDLALCTFVDPGKHDFGPVLRANLTQIEREG